MANHKYKNRKQQRAGCQMCKPQKTGGMNPDKEVGHKGFGKIKKLLESGYDLKHMEETPEELLANEEYLAFKEEQKYRDDL